MQVDRRAHIIVAAVFLALIMAPGLIQTVAELRRGERPRSLNVFLRASDGPEPARLRATP